MEITRQEAKLILAWKKNANCEQTEKEYELAKKLREFVESEGEECQT